MLAASTLRACTSKPAQLRTFAMVGTSPVWMLWSTVEGVNLGEFSLTARQARGVPTTYLRHDDRPASIGSST
jgi:hypothetical protein